MSTREGQEKSRKRVLTLEVAGGGRTFDFSNQELKMIPAEEPEIKLHFLRFGLFSEAEESGIVKAEAQPLPENGEPVVEGMHGELYTTEKGATQELDEVIVMDPKLENYSYARTGLKKGFLYIMDEADPDTPVEYEIGEGGRFSSISWEKQTDLRPKDGKLSTNGHHVAEHEAVLWVAYSPVQWSVDFYNRLKGDTADRKLYMKKVVCTGFKDGEEEVQGDFMPVDKATAYFTEANASSARSLTSKMDALQCREQEDREKHEEKRPEKEFVRPDMFITLNDPLNNLFEVSDSLAKKTLEFRALIDAIQSGETLTGALQRIENGNDTPPEPDENYASLFSLALTSYLMVYADEASEKKYDGGVTGWYDGKKERGTDHNPRVAARRGHYDPDADEKGWTGGLDRAKVEGIIGFEDRQKFRKIVQSYRDDYALCVTSKYCKSHFEYYLHNHPERTLYGCQTLFDTILAFYPNPYNWDRHLLLKKDYKKEDDLQNWVYKLLDDEQQYTVALADEGAVNSKAPNFEGTDALYALLTKPIALEKPVEDDPLKYSLAVAGILKAKLQVHSDEVFSTRSVKGRSYKSIKAKHTFVAKKINKKFKLGKDLVKMKGNQMRLNPEVFTKHAGVDWEAVKKGEYSGGKKKVLKILKRYDGLVYVGKENGKHTFEIPFEKSGDKLSKSEVRSNSLNQKASIVLNSRAFHGTVAFLQILNLKGAFENLVSDPSTLKNQVNLAGVSAELSEVVLTLQKLHLENIGKSVSASLSKALKITGFIGGAVSAGMCFHESVQSFNKRDNDAGFALMGAGIAFTTFLFVTGPIGWIVLGIGVALVLLADWLKDTPLEYFFKNFLLSDAERFARNATETPMRFNQRLFENRHDLVENEDNKKIMMHPKDAEATLLDAIVCRKIIFEPLNLVSKQRRNTYNGTPGGGISVYDIKIFKFKVTINFFHLFNDKNQFNQRIFLFPYGMKGGKFWEISNTQEKKNIKNEKMNIGVSVVFDIPEVYRHHINEGSVIIYAAQLNVGEGNHALFPLPRDNDKNRYMGTKLKPTSVEVMHIDATQEKYTKNLPLAQLLKYKTWKN